MDYNYRYNEAAKGAGRRAAKGEKGTRRLTVCLLVFAAAFVIKTFFPSAASSLGTKISEAINGSVDYKAAFSAVGGFISGDATLEEAIAVIKGTREKSESPNAVEAANSADKFHGSGAAEHNMQNTYLQVMNEKLRNAAENSVQEAFADEPEAKRYEPDNELPENVSGEAAELPFECAAPVKGERSSEFGYRMHPVENVQKFHYGVDFAADEGADIFAFADGYIAAVGESETAGNYLVISHGDGWTTQYFHCSEVFRNVGSEVKKGELVAAVGHTGTATGPNLHFELIHNGVYYDPWKSMNGKN